VEDGALSVNTETALPPLESEFEAGFSEQVTPEAAEQVRFTAPLNPRIEARLTVSVALPPPATGTIVVCGVSVKSERGLTILRTVEEGASVPDPP
jgi:hypothetical protein